MNNELIDNSLNITEENSDKTKDIPGIYCIENLTNGKKYIGQARNIRKRWNLHKYYLSRGTDSIYLQRAFDKTEFDNFKFYIIEECSPESLNEREIYWIERYKTFGYNGEFGYNLTSGSLTPLHASDDTKEKMSKNHANFHGENNPMYGKHHCEGVRKILSEKAKKRQYLSGENHPFYGKHHSEKTKELLSSIRIENKLALGENNPRFGKKLFNASSKYFGVSFDKSKNKWRAFISFNKETKFIGTYFFEIDAVLAYNNYIIKNGLDKPLNFIDF